MFVESVVRETHPTEAVFFTDVLVVLVRGAHPTFACMTFTQFGLHLGLI